MKRSAKGQAMVEDTIQIQPTAFDKQDKTSIYWLGNGGAMINSQGTVILIDPLLKGFDMPLLMNDMPLDPLKSGHIDAVLITHIDNDHYSRPTCTDLKDKTDRFYAPNYVAEVMDEEGYPVSMKTIWDEFPVGQVNVQLTPALHNWQNNVKKWQYRYWKPEDYCGYYLNTPDGKIWMPGDSQLLCEQLERPVPDVILFDFADNASHITLDGAVKLANTYPDSDLIAIHWGCVDAPEMSPFNGDPEKLRARIVNPDRLKVLAPGEEYILNQ